MRTTFVILLLASALATTTPAAAQTIEGYAPGADSVRIHFLQAGAVDSRHTLLFIPGWRVSASIWSEQLGHFSALGYRVIAMDSRSQAGSSVVKTGNAPEDRARDIQAVITALKLTHLTLVGWSQGAQDVAAYVERYGTGSLDRLALIDSPVSSGPADVKENPVFVQIELQGIAAFSRDPQAYSDGMMHAIISAPAPATVLAGLAAESMHTPPDIGISMLIQDMFTIDRRPSLKKFDKPTLVVASGKSPLLDAQRQMAAALPHAQFSIIADAAHAVFFDQPEAFDQKLEVFVSGGATPEANGASL